MQANGEPLPRSLTQAMLEQPLSDDNVQKWVGGTVCKPSLVFP